MSVVGAGDDDAWQLVSLHYSHFGTRLQWAWREDWSLLWEDAQVAPNCFRQDIDEEDEGKAGNSVAKQV